MTDFFQPKKITFFASVSDGVRLLSYCQSTCPVCDNLLFPTLSQLRSHHDDCDVSFCDAEDERHNALDPSVKLDAALLVGAHVKCAPMDGLEMVYMARAGKDDRVFLAGIAPPVLNLQSMMFADEVVQLPGHLSLVYGRSEVLGELKLVGRASGKVSDGEMEDSDE